MQKTKDLIFHDNILKKYMKRHSSMSKIQGRSYLMSFRQIKNFYEDMNKQILKEKIKKAQIKNDFSNKKKSQSFKLMKCQKITVNQSPIYFYKRRNLVNILKKKQDTLTEPQSNQIVRRRQSFDKCFQYLKKDVQSCFLTNSKSMRYILSASQNKKVVQSKKNRQLPLYNIKRSKNPLLKKIFFAGQNHDENKNKMNPKKKKVRFDQRLLQSQCLE